MKSHFDSESIDDSLSDFEHAEFLDCKFHNLNLQNKSLRYSRFIDCVFENCNLSNISVTGTTLNDCKFINCKLFGVNFSSIENINNPEFKRCNLNLCTFQELKLEKFKAVDSVIQETDFAQANLEESNFSGSSLQGSIFSQTNLTKADFSRATSYFIDPRENKIKGAQFSAPEAYVFFKALKIIVD